MKPIHRLNYIVLIASLMVSLTFGIQSPQPVKALTWTNKTTANGLGHNIVYGVFIDESTIYAATYGGVSISTDGANTFTNKDAANGLSNDNVFGVSASGLNVYAATWGGGLYISKDGGDTFNPKTTLNGLGSDLVRDVAVSGANVYAATNNGVSISTDGGGIFTNKTTANGLGNNSVSGVFANGFLVYAATYGGLSKSFFGGPFTNKTTADGLGSNDVNGVFLDGSIVYAATAGGLSISTDGGATFTNKTTANGLGSNIVNGVYARGSIVYAATNGGLSISMDGGNTFANNTTANGLGSNTVTDVLATVSTVYAATNGGLSFAPAAVPSVPKWTHCADEGGTCAFSGTRWIRYGVAGKYVYKQFTDGATCNIAAFGSDPAPGKIKTCDASSIERAKNGGFNNYPNPTSMIPNSWKAVNFSAIDGKSAAVKQEGTASVAIAGQTGKTKTLTQTFLKTGNSGDKYTFSFYSKGASVPVAGICRVQVLFYDGTTLKLTKTANCPTGTYGFQKRSIPFSVTSAYTKVVIKFTYSKASGKVWFDAASLLDNP